jgi:hypothetical protein
MLTSRLIPQHLDTEPQNWERFLGKAAKGSYKAVEMLDAADLAYMSALSTRRDANAAPVDSYHFMFRKCFPRSPPATTPQELFVLCFRNGYFPNQLHMDHGPRLPDSAYCNLWAGGKPVQIDDLVHDAVLTCFKRWSHELCLNEPGDTDYDSLAVVTSMMALCISWPG